MNKNQREKDAVIQLCDETSHDNKLSHRAMIIFFGE